MLLRYMKWSKCCMLLETCNNLSAEDIFRVMFSLREHETCLFWAFHLLGLVFCPAAVTQVIQWPHSRRSANTTGFHFILPLHELIIQTSFCIVCLYVRRLLMHFAFYTTYWDDYILDYTFIFKRPITMLILFPDHLYIHFCKWPVWTSPECFVKLQHKGQCFSS